MKVLITGGAGFIGQYIVENLHKRGIRVLLFDYRKKYQSTYKERDGVEVFRGDIRDREAVDHAVSIVDGAINLAGVLGTSEMVNDPYPAVEVNIMGALNFLEACRHHKKRGVQIGIGNYFMNNPYSISKSAMERFTLMYNKEHKTRVAIVRAYNAYGPRQKHAPVKKAIPTFALSALRGESIRIYGDGKQIVDLIYVGDVAEILVRALINNHKVYDQVFEAGTGRPVTVNYVAKLINTYAGNDKITHLPMRPGEQSNATVLADPKTLKPLGKFTFTKLEEGLKKTVDWYKENQSLYKAL